MLLNCVRNPRHVLQFSFPHFISRCPPVLDIVLKTLLAYMAASRAYLSSYLQRTPNISRRNTETTTNPLPTDQEREELKGALVAAQESAAVQILLEICLPFANEKVKIKHIWNNGIGYFWNVLWMINRFYFVYLHKFSCILVYILSKTECFVWWLQVYCIKVQIW